MINKLNIAILLNDLKVENWIYRVIEKITAMDFEKITFIIDNRTSWKEKKKLPLFLRFHEYLDHFLYYGRYDYNAKTDCSDLTKREENNLIGVKFWPAASDDDKPDSAIFGGPLYDVVVNFNQSAGLRPSTDLSRLGILFFSVEDRVCPGSKGVAYSSLVDRKLEIECSVNLINSGGGVQSICKSSVSTFSNSIHINRNRALGLAELLIPRAIENIYIREKTDHGILMPSFIEGSFSEKKMPSLPSSAGALRNFIRLHLHSLRKKVLYLDNELWFLMLYRNKNLDFTRLDSLSEYIKLEAPKGYYWADPFIINDNKVVYLFAEEYSFKTGKANLVVIKPDSDGNYAKSQIIFEKPYHLSYPFIFKHEGTFYMIPETKSQKAIQIFRCTEFPDQWEYVTDLMGDVAAADTTIFYHNKKWWMFTSIDCLQNDEVSFGELFLYYANDLFSGNWEFHPQNPIVTDIGRSRPAGAIFEKAGMLIRPSQDCSGGYGRAVNFNQIIKMSETEYEEKIIKRVAPDWDKSLVGMHTYNSVNDFYIFDACRLRKRSLFRKTCKP